MTVCDGWTIGHRTPGHDAWWLDHIGPGYPSLDYAVRQADLEAVTNPDREYIVFRLTAATDIIPATATR